MALSASVQRKFASILLALTIFTVLGGLLTYPLDVPFYRGVLIAAINGILVGLFEEFYVQSRAGRWLRNMHPLRSVFVYTLVVVFIYLAVLHTIHFLIIMPGRDLAAMYRRLPIVIPIVVGVSVAGILVIRIIHFIGPETLFHLMVGTYHRPVLERKVLVFVDMKDSTALVERLGPVRAKSLIGKFLFDVSKPITNHGGDIYLYIGDGLIAMWDWNVALTDGRVLRAVDEMFATVSHESAVYQTYFDVVPVFRVGVHGGEVVISEQGDTKRAIGIYGETINIAARMEQAAKAHGLCCIVSGDIVAALGTRSNRLHYLGQEHVHGVSEPIPIYEYKIA